MIVVTNRVPVAPGHEADFEDRFRNRAHLIDRSPGFVKNLVMRPVNRRFSHATQTIDAVAVPERVAQALGLTVGHPLIRMERVYFAADKSVLDVAVAHYHPARYQFEIKIVPRGLRQRQDGAITAAEQDGQGD